MVYSIWIFVVLALYPCMHGLAVLRIGTAVGSKLTYRHFDECKG
ncbi:hypothetical protein HDF10_001688 [Edaphobacter lichenicola]|uniref:Uncharacterized protein n=1 Tax=Tunturiibacter lichenicola TaxID=2051959 RepID=A0A7W8N3R4_9BACT|nr:hypothetical protein [Edaphobacter lichenicola]